MSNSSSGIGQSRGRIRAYQLPMPASVPEILQLVAEELQIIGLHSIHVEEGVPISVERYVEPDDLLNPRGAPMSPQEVLRQVDPLIDMEPKGTPQATLLHCLGQLQQVRMTCAGIIIGSIKRFMMWMDLPDTFLLSMQSLDRSCDYMFVGHRIYIDASLDADRMIVLGGDTAYPTLTSVRMAIQTVMEVKNVKQLPVGEGSDGACGAAKGRGDLRRDLPDDGPSNQGAGNN